MADGDQKKTVILRKSDEKDPLREDKRARESAPPTHKQGQPTPPPRPAPPAPAPAGDDGKTQIIGGGGRPDAGADRLQARPQPAPPSPPVRETPVRGEDDGSRTRVFRPEDRAQFSEKAEKEDASMREQPVMEQDEQGRITNPVVGWLVVVAGPGAGGYRAIFDGRNRIGRTASADVPLDFGDPGISREQATIHYDPKDRSFLFIPQLDVENFTYINQAKAIAATELKPLDEIEIAATTLRFVPLCGPQFDWSDLSKK